MRLNDVFHNRQPQPGAASITAAGFINAEEAFEYFVQRFSWNAGAIVSGGSGAAVDKIAAMEESGFVMAASPAGLVEAVIKAIANFSD